MKVVKLTKKMLNMDPMDLLVVLGAFSKEKKQTYPEHVYFSKEDYKTLRENIKKRLKKAYPDMSSHYLALSVGTELLAYGPSERLATAVKPGYALIDTDSIDTDSK